MSFFFFNDTATTEIYTLSLHDALPISLPEGGSAGRRKTPRGAAAALDRGRAGQAPAEDRSVARHRHGLRSGHGEARHGRAGPRAGPYRHRRGGPDRDLGRAALARHVERRG